MRLIASAILSICLTTVGAEAKGKPKDKGNGNQGGLPVTNVTIVNMGFGPSGVQVIHQYYGANPVSLPPGLQKKLAQGKPLPPGWQKKLQPFPVEVERQLTPLPAGYGRGVIDGHAVIFSKGSHAVVDVAVLF